MRRKLLKFKDNEHFQIEAHKHIENSVYFISLKVEKFCLTVASDFLFQNLKKSLQRLSPKRFHHFPWHPRQIYSSHNTRLEPLSLPASLVLPDSMMRTFLRECNSHEKPTLFLLQSSVFVICDSLAPCTVLCDRKFCHQFLVFRLMGIYLFHTPCSCAVKLCTM